MVIGSNPIKPKYMTRSVWKPVITEKNLTEYTFNRNNTITPNLVGKTIKIHQGKIFISYYYYNRYRKKIRRI